ncbi:MAG: U32 family peptidase [Leptolyngbya sp. SIO4C1]|nr:U32 family peptidase [Leptolyngbya sp. SIO4C1]
MLQSLTSVQNSVRPELLAPAGSWDCARAAVENGADAVYFGLDRFNARMRAHNFTEADLPELMVFLHQRGVKGYVTLNTLVFPSELAATERYLRRMIAAGVDAVIVQDVGICRLIQHLSPDFPIHASTQMTVTSVAGVSFAERIGCSLVVLARECSLKEINKIQRQLQDRDLTMPLEVFVHGALCVAYSGQCLTSESLGGRSANRGECAQACRMTYELIADGEPVDLGDRQYLLSPQELSGLPVLTDLMEAGVSCLKIEGRLKTPEYVANVTRVYRQALDRVLEQADAADVSSPGKLRQGHPQRMSTAGYDVSAAEQYDLEMAFSRGLYTGWFRGIDHQVLVHARFAKKRGVYLGEIKQVARSHVRLHTDIPIKPGDGVVFDSGHPEHDPGGRIYAVERQGKQVTLSFGRHDIDLRHVRVGHKLWKTSDPDLDKALRQTYSGHQPKFQRPIDIEIHGSEGKKLVAIATDPEGHIAQANSAMPLVAAHSQPLTGDRLAQQFARLGNTPFHLGHLTSHLASDLMLPISELNHLRRTLVESLLTQRAIPKRWQLDSDATYQDLLPSPYGPGDAYSAPTAPDREGTIGIPSTVSPRLIPLVRTLDQLRAVLQTPLTTLYCEFENPAHYRDAVAMVRTPLDPASSTPQNPKSLYLAPPRITKPSEQYILKQVRQVGADGYLIRNYDQLEFFAGERCVGDFSLNVANPITADYFKQTLGLERLTASYDLNVQQLENLLAAAPPAWFDITIHQHMPMFHMEHCVFCAFLSEGTDFTNCGRPCESREVKLRDRVGTEHVLQADAGCRNTVFNGVAQTGAEFVQRLIERGAVNFRIDFLNESPQQVVQTVDCYQQLLRGEISGRQLWQRLQLSSQLGVTRGTLEARSQAH